MFGSRNPRPPVGRQPPSQQPGQGTTPYSRLPPDGAGGYGTPSPYGRQSAGNDRPYYDSAPPEKHEYSRGGGRSAGSGQVWQLKPAKAPGNQFIFGNLYDGKSHFLESGLIFVYRAAVSSFDFPPSRDGQDLYLMLNDFYVLSARPVDAFPQGQISLSDPQRTWASISLMDTVNVKIYDPFQEGGHKYLGSIDVEISFAGRKTTEAPFDQDELAKHFIRVRRLHSVGCHVN